VDQSDDLLDSDEGASTVVLIAIVALVAVRLAGTEASETFSGISAGLENERKSGFGNST